MSSYVVRLRRARRCGGLDAVLRARGRPNPNLSLRVAQVPLKKLRELLVTGGCTASMSKKAIASIAEHKKGMRAKLVQNGLLLNIKPAGGSRKRPVPSPLVEGFNSDLIAATYDVKQYAAVGFKNMSPEVERILTSHGIEPPQALLSDPAPEFSGAVGEVLYVGVVLHSKPRSEKRRKKHKFAAEVQPHLMVLIPLSDGRYVLTASAMPKNLGIRVLTPSGRAPRSRGVQGLRAGGVAAVQRRGAIRKPKLAKPKAKAEPKRNMLPKLQAALRNTRSTRSTRNTPSQVERDTQSLSPLEEALIEEDPCLSEGSLYDPLPYPSVDRFPDSPDFAMELEPGSSQAVPFYVDDDDLQMISLLIDEPVHNIMGAAQLGM